MTLISKIWKKLRNRRYRYGFTVAQLKQGIAFQIKTLRKRQRLSQAQLAQQAGIDQSSVSRAENPEYGDLTLNTLLSIAEGFDVALICEFVPFSELVDRTQRLPHKSEHIRTFAEEDAAMASDEAPSRARDVQVDGLMLYQLGRPLPPQRASRPRIAASLIASK